ncbi:MAG: non-ribosomal peptide synthetase/polyketide synthase hybrid enzyme, partial [Cyanobacteriota bacterium]
MSVGDQQGIAHDKPGTLSDLHDRLMQQHPDIEQESLIAAVLLMEPSVEDCAVFSRTHHKVAGTVARHPAEFVACVVNSGAFSADRFRSFLSERLPANLVPAHYLPLSRLPLQGDGRVDFASLKRLPILDDELIAAWEAVATQTPAVEQAAVMVKPTRLQTPAVHLSELLPHGHSLDPLSPQFATTIDEAPADVPPASTVMSLTYGGDLPTPAGFPQTLPEVLQQAAAKALGDRITHLEADGTIVQQSYAQLLAEAQCILTGLRQQGLKPQDKVIFQLELTQDIVAAFWGCVLGGFIPVIMGTAPSYREANNVVDKLCNVWRLIDEPLILTTQALQTSLQHLEQWLPGDAAPPSRLKISAIEDLRQNTPDPHPHPCQPDDLAFFNLTSGSTGMPKCIGLTHRNLITRAQGTNILCQHSPEDVILNWLPFDHIGSISDWHIRCVLLGCFLIYTTKEYVLGRPLNWIDLLHRYRISHSWAPNFAYALVNDSLKQDAEAKYPWDLSCVKGLLTAGEAVSSSAVEEFIDRLAVYGFPRTALRSAFGMAEMGSGITYYQPTIEKPVLRHVVDKASLTGDVPLRRVTPDHPNCSIFTDLGPVIPGISIRIVNGQNELLPEEMVGNLQVKGLPVSPGYYKNPTVNQEVFLADGWFQTGDLGFVSQDHLVITGRAKETIIINGANYYNHEIEAAVELVDQVEVSFTAACGVKAPGSATEKLAIFFNTAVEAEEDLAELLKTIRQTVVAKVGLNPDYLIPVAQGAVPKTAIGKIQRSQLSQRFEQGEFQDILKHMDLLLGNANTIPDWFFRQVWQPKQISTPVVSLGTTVTLIFEDGSGLGDQLQALLRREGGQCMAVMPGEGFTVLGNDTYAVNPTQPEDYHTLFQHLDEQNQRPTQILYLWGTGDAPLPVPDEPTPW